MKITQDKQATTLNVELLLLERNLAEKESEITELNSVNTKLNSSVDDLNFTVENLTSTVEDLKFQLAQLKRMLFGSKRERFESNQNPDQDYNKGRGANAPLKNLSTFKGYLQTDGYTVYEQFARNPEVTHLASMAHARRMFDKARGNYMP